MSEAETIELIAAYLNNLAVWMSIYLSVTFAYLVVSHTVGSKLSGFQTTVISIIYVVAAFIAWGGMLASQLWIQSLIVSNPMTLRTQGLKFMMKMDFWLIALGVMVLSGILVTLYYLYDIRRSSGKRRELPDSTRS